MHSAARRRVAASGGSHDGKTGCRA